jgi:hypothetical protein
MGLLLSGIEKPRRGGEAFLFLLYKFRISFWDEKTANFL